MKAVFLKPGTPLRKEDFIVIEVTKAWDLLGKTLLGVIPDEEFDFKDEKLNQLMTTRIESRIQGNFPVFSANAYQRHLQRLEMKRSMDGKQ